MSQKVLTICSLHFKESSFNRTMTNERLRDDAVPFQDLIKARAALHRDVRLISTECCHLLGLAITKEAMEIIAELVYAKIPVYGADIEAFAKHAKRSAINAEDVKLLVRRNPSLKSHLNSLSSSTPAVKEKRRKTLPVAKQPTPPAKKDVVAKESPVSADGKGSAGDAPKPDADKMVVDDAIDLTFDD